MSNTKRNILTIFMILALVTAAFAAGFMTNDLVQTSLPAGASGSSARFALLNEAWSWIEHSYLGELPDAQQITYGAIRGALSSLGDPYTIFVEPPDREAERERLSGNFGGIGASLIRDEAGQLVLEPIPGNPAEEAGILPGDVLLAVDGQSIPADMPVDQVAELIKGEKGTAVTLTVVHPGTEAAIDITIVRDDILLPSVTYRLLDEDATIGYIQLSRFSGESGAEISRAIAALQSQGAQELILDLRQNPGGLLNASVEVADHFLDGGVVLYQQNRETEEEIYEASPGGSAVDMPLVVLVDGGTASSAEILAGALQDHGRALLIGAPTFGKGSVQLVYDLSDGSSVHVTASRWLTPDRHQIDEQGLEPDILVEVTQEALDTGRDEILLRAVETLQNS